MLGFRLWPNNYIAADIIEGGGRFKQYFTEAEKVNFEQTMLAKTTGLSGMDLEEVREIYLRIYANPVFNSDCRAKIIWLILCFNKKVAWICQS